MSFQTGKVNVTTACWRNLAKPKIKAGTHVGIGTNMRSTACRAIWLPDVTGSRGKKDIFIHSGSGPSSSEGCIVVRQPEFAKAWLNIHPKNTRNISVVIADA